MGEGKPWSEYIVYIFIFFFFFKEGVGEMAQRLTALAALEEDPA